MLVHTPQGIRKATEHEEKEIKKAEEFNGVWNEERIKKLEEEICRLKSLSVSSNG